MRWFIKISLVDTTECGRF